LKYYGIQTEIKEGKERARKKREKKKKNASKQTNMTKQLRVTVNTVFGKNRSETLKNQGNHESRSPECRALPFCFSRNIYDLNSFRDTKMQQAHN